MSNVFIGAIFSTYSIASSFIRRDSYRWSMLDFRTSIGDLRQIFSPINKIAESCEIRFTEDGLYIPAADLTSIAIADIFVESSSFQVYESEGERIGLQLSKLTDILSMAQDEDFLKLHLDNDNLLHIEVENKEFVLGLVSLDSVPKQPSIPDYEYSTEFSLESAILEDSVKTTGVFADKIIFNIDETNEVIEMRAKGDIDRTCVTLGRSDLEDYRLRNLENSFSQGYLSDIMSVIPNDTIAIVRMTASHTMEIEYPIINGGGNVVFTLAPWN